MFQFFLILINQFSIFENCHCEFDLSIAATKVCALYPFEFQSYVTGIRYAKISGRLHWLKN